MDEDNKPEEDKQEFDLATTDKKEILRQEQNGIFRVNLTKLEFLCYDLAELGKYDFPLIIFNFGKKTSLGSHTLNQKESFDFKSEIEGIQKYEQELLE